MNYALFQVSTNIDAPAPQFYPRAEFGLSSEIPLERIHDLMQHLVKISRQDLQKAKVGSPEWCDTVWWFFDKRPGVNPFSFVNICEELGGNLGYCLGPIKEIIKSRREAENVKTKARIGALRDGAYLDNLVLYGTRPKSFAHVEIPVSAHRDVDGYKLLTLVQGPLTIDAFKEPSSDIRSGFMTVGESVDRIVLDHISQYESLVDNYSQACFEPAWLEEHGRKLLSFEREY